MKTYGDSIQIKREFIHKMEEFDEAIIEPMVKSMGEYAERVMLDVIQAGTNVNYFNFDYDDDTLIICPIAGDLKPSPSAADPLAQYPPCFDCPCSVPHYSYECCHRGREDCPKCREVD